MKNSCTYFIKSIAFFALFLVSISCSNHSNTDFSEVVKVALRDVGHQLLLANNDSTSLVQPIIALNQSKYELSFDTSLVIHPDSLVTIIKNSFSKADLPPYYLTEVIPCNENLVVYSYEMKFNTEQGIIPCGDRQLKNACYSIQVRFTKVAKELNNSYYFIYGFVIAIILLIAFLIFKKKSQPKTNTENYNVTTLGHFKFYPEQNKLIKEATEISLSRKECELLTIFVKYPNQIIKREELNKKVWEDNGVFVGRSLDTYISKLRKKLKDDNSIKITNVHGIGYKLEIDA